MNLTEALQLLLGRSLEEIKAANQTPEKEPDEPSKPVIAMEEWRRAEPTHVRKARLARRSGRYARYQQVIALHEQGMKPKEIARHLGIGERTVQRWLAAGTFPEVRLRRKIRLNHSPCMFFRAGKPGKETVWPSSEKSKNRATPDQHAVSIRIWRRSNKLRSRHRPTRSAF